MVDAGEITTVLKTRTFNHPNTTVETDLVEHILLTEKEQHHFSFRNLTQQTKIRVFERIDGSVYDQLGDTVTFPDDFGDAKGVIIVLDGAGQDMKITLESVVSEGAARVIEASIRDTIRVE